MTKVEATLRFMQASIRGRDGKCVAALTEGELFEAFNTLATPETSFEEWAARSQIDLAAINAHEQQLISNANADALAVLQASGVPVKVGAPAVAAAPAVKAQ